jgi:hypothetical protein
MGIRGIVLIYLDLRILMYTGKVTAIIRPVKKNSALSGSHNYISLLFAYGLPMTANPS